MTDKQDFDVRAEFERWYSGGFTCSSSERDWGGEYIDAEVEKAWAAWSEAIERFVNWIPHE